MKKRRVIKLLLIIASILTIMIVILSIYLFVNSSNKEISNKKEAIKYDTKEPQEHSLSMIMVGDALIHSNLYLDAQNDNGTYDFRPMLEYIKPIINKYDLAYYNQETILGGKELGLSSYPRFNSPYEVGDAFIDSGFNMVSLANNHTMDKGEEGVLRSLQYWNSKNNVIKAGQYSSYEDRNTSKIYERKGIKYAFLSYTTWTNGLETPIGKEYLNNIYSNEKAQEDISKVREQADVVIVAMHWGVEYYLGVSEQQSEIANYLSTLGVDVIIGTHPHVVEPIEYIGKTLVIYSLGNFISDQVGIERLTGLMISLQIHKKVEKNQTMISIDNIKADLTYTKSTYGRDFKVYPYSKLTNLILPNYREYYEKYKQIVLERYNNIDFNLLGGE